MIRKRKKEELASSQNERRKQTSQQEVRKRKKEAIHTMVLPTKTKGNATPQQNILSSLPLSVFKQLIYIYIYKQLIYTHTCYIYIYIHTCCTVRVYNILRKYLLFCYLY